MKNIENDTSLQNRDSMDEKIFSVICSGNCQSRCRLHVHVRDNRIVKTSMAPFPDPRYNRVCLRGLSHVQRIYDPNRLKYPMKRVGERGEGKWERISWDEAIDMIVTKFKGYQEEFGKQSVLFSTSSGNMAWLSGFYSSHRIANLMHASVTDNSIDMSDTHGLGRVIGNGGNFNQRSDPADMAFAKTILVWAANPTDSHPHDWRFIIEAQEAGAKIVVIDPRFTASASKADMWVSLRPGSDPALALAMAHVIINEKIYDEDYLLKHTVAPFLVRPDNGRFLRLSDITGIKPEKPVKDRYMVWDSTKGEAVPLDEDTTPTLEGTYDAAGMKVTTAFTLLKNSLSDYTPEKAAKLCDIEEQVIRDLARLYAVNTPSTIYPGYIQYDNGLQTGHAWGVLASLTGNIAKKGASLGHTGLSGYNLNLKDFMFPTGVNSPTIPWIHLKDVLQSGKFQGKPYPIKALYLWACNQICNASNQNETIDKIFNAIDFIVVVDMVETDTTRYADLILPAAHWFEKVDLTQGPDQPTTTISEKAVEPLWESKPDMEIYRRIAYGMGLGEYFKYTDEEFVQLLIDTDKARAAGLTWERLKEEKVVQTLPSGWINWEGNRFPSPSGRLEFYLENPKPRLDCGIEIDKSKEHLPYFRPPVEAWPENPLHKKYPLVYHTERIRWRLHSQWFNVPWLREIDPEPTIKINPKDAKERGIENDDIVEAFNDRGHVVLKAVLHEGCRPGMVSVPKGWHRTQFISGSYQELTHDHCDTTHYNQSFYDVLCDVRKYQQS